MAQKFHHIEVCIAFEREGVYLCQRGEGVDAKAFNTCKGIVIIIGETEERGVLWAIQYAW